MREYRNEKEQHHDDQSAGRKNPLRLLWIALGFLCLGLGTVGIVLPLLPTVPFYMATAFCFAKSSRKLHRMSAKADAWEFRSWDS